MVWYRKTSLTIMLLVALTGSGASQIPRPSASQLPSTPPSTQGVGVKLDAPLLKGREAITESTIKSEVTEKTRQATEGVRPEVIVPGMPPDKAAGIAREVILSSVPFGYGTIMKTKSAVDPGPQVDGKDPRVIDLTQQGRVEAQVGDSNFLPVSFLETGLTISRAVARVAHPFLNLPDAGIGTGFMISPSLFMTNNHVIGDAGIAAKFELHFNYQYAPDGSTILSPIRYELDPNSFFYTSQDLDFTIVRVKPRTEVPTGAGGTTRERTAAEEFGFVRLVTTFYYSLGQLANVVQHPQGRPKEIAVHENKIDKLFANVVRYTTDTEPGSSGSPVFNNQWRLIALHHAAGEQNSSGKYVDNEGIRIDKIIEHLKKVSPAKIPADIIKELGI